MYNLKISTDASWPFWQYLEHPEKGTTFIIVNIPQGNSDTVQ